ncbi:MAG: NAD(P)/FAD-dependent oxidoreductase, partial [Sandarakinorhabdus sp.]|nr:NAD(P)/FAD-dependent oxidoreductase [Sandarakinorhabdus sp.]
MDRPIVRRDFIGGIAVAGGVLGSGGAALAQASAPALPPEAAAYPPLLTGLRGQYPGSFETAHQARDGDFSGAVPADDSGEHYDLVIVGGGISGLSAAHFYRQALGDDRKILIVDNHDDFGGHAKRNEFNHQGRTILGYGGTMSIESPFPYSFTAKKLLADLGVDLASYRRYETDAYAGLGAATFFDKQHFGADKLVTGTGKKPWAAFFAEAPLSPAVRADLTRLHTEKVDYLPGLGPDAKADALRRISYQDFLLKNASLLPESLPYFAGQGYRNNKRVDTVPAWEVAMGGRSPGFAGMALPDQITAEAQHFHWPDGNASVARLLVNRLVPGVFVGPLDQEKVVLARANYAALDNPANPTRIRLNSMVIRVEHVGPTTRNTEKAVRIVYVRGGKRTAVTAANVILACFNNIIPYLVPALPEAQKAALQYASKVPMQYTNVLLRNWRPWAALGIKSIQAPNGYHTSASLDTPMAIGGYASAANPDEAVVIHMVRNPNQPGLPRKEQNRIGRADMLATEYPTIEREIRGQLQRMLGSAGFDAARDIAAITVNRWPHGYAYTYDTLGDPDMPDEARPHILGRQTFGRIAIANADAAASAFT